MEEDDKGCPIIRMGVSGWMFLLVPAYPGSPGQKAVKWLCVCVYIYVQTTSFDGVFLLVAFHCIALVCNCCFLAWSIKYLHIYLPQQASIGYSKKWDQLASFTALMFFINLTLSVGICSLQEISEGKLKGSAPEHLHEKMKDKRQTRGHRENGH